MAGPGLGAISAGRSTGLTNTVGELHSAGQPKRFFEPDSNHDAVRQPCANADGVAHGDGICITDVSR